MTVYRVELETCFNPRVTAWAVESNLARPSPPAWRSSRRLGRTARGGSITTASWSAGAITRRRRTLISPIRSERCENPARPMATRRRPAGGAARVVLDVSNAIPAAGG